MSGIDTQPLRDLVRNPGPFASAYLDVSHDTEDATAQLELRRRAVSHELLLLGADGATVDAIDEAIEWHEPAVGPAGLAVIGAGGSVLHTEVLPEPLPAPLVRLAPLPYLVPIVEQARAVVPHVVVVVDRTGADLSAVGASGPTVELKEVEGTEHQVHQVGGGGWSHRSIRSRVQEHVRQNLEQVAAEVARLAAEVNARAVIVAGELQARSGLLAVLPESASRIAVELTAGSRAAGSDQERLQPEIEHVLDRIARQDRQSMLDAYHGHRGVQGLSAATAALREGNAEAVLIDPAVLCGRTVWLAQEPTQLAATADELRELGWGGADKRPADEVVPAAAVAVAARLGVAGDVEPDDGVGIVRRYT